MSDSRPVITKQDVRGHSMRMVRLENIDFVSMQDFCNYLQQLVSKIVELSARQQAHITFMSSTLDVVCDVLGEKDADLRRELLRAVADQRARLV